MSHARRLLVLVALFLGVALSPATRAALPDLAPVPARNGPAADAACTGCHADERAGALSRTPHGMRSDARTPACQGCHGPSLAHARGAASPGGARRPAPDVTFSKGGMRGAGGGWSQSTERARSEPCLGCHKGGDRLHWDGGQHQQQGVACNDCHAAHKERDPVLTRATQAQVCFTCHKKERAETHRMSTHPIDAGKVACADCHNPHGSAGPKLVRGNTVNETCFNCHAEKRGPFLWSHAMANDDCMNCHTPHGSTIAPLLKVRSPYLCQQCHGNTTPHAGNIYSGAGLPGRAVATINQSTAAANPVNPLTGARVGSTNPPAYLAFRGCMNCHPAVHGSNHPGGIYLTR